MMISACTLVVFGFTVDQVSQANTPTRRELDLVELWSGCGSLVTAAQNQKLRAASFDKLNHDTQDFTSLIGFQAAFHLVMQLKQGALLWQGVDCSSFTFADSSRCQRSKEHREGNTN